MLNLRSIDHNGISGAQASTDVQHYSQNLSVPIFFGNIGEDLTDGHPEEDVVLGSATVNESANGLSVRIAMQDVLEVSYVLLYVIVY